MADFVPGAVVVTRADGHPVGVVESRCTGMRTTVERDRIGERLVDSVGSALHPTSVQIWIAG